MMDRCAGPCAEVHWAVQRGQPLLGRGDCLGRDRGTADEASVTTPSAHVLCMWVTYPSVNTSLRELLPPGFIPSMKRTQNPITHVLIIAKQVSSLAAQTGPHVTETTSGQGSVQTPNLIHFGLSVARPRLLLTTKLTWKCLHHCEYRGRKH